MSELHARYSYQQMIHSSDLFDDDLRKSIEDRLKDRILKEDPLVSDFKVTYFIQNEMFEKFAVLTGYKVREGMALIRVVGLGARR